MSKAPQSRKKVAIINKGSQEIAAPATAADQYFQMVNAAMASGNIDQLERMMQMKRDFEADEARKAYADAMAEFRGICPPIKKDARVNFTSAKGVTDYNHETFDGIMLTVSPSLSECGLSTTFRSASDAGLVKVTCIVTHKDGHTEETSLSAAPDSSGGKNAIQAVGSIVTYLQRYTIKLMLGLSAGEDNDAATPAPEIELITEDQANEIFALITENQCRTVDAWLAIWAKKAKWDIASIEEIPASVFDGCLSMLKSAIKSDQQKAKDNA